MKVVICCLTTLQAISGATGVGLMAVYAAFGLRAMVRNELVGFKQHDGLAYGGMLLMALSMACAVGIIGL